MRNWTHAHIVGSYRQLADGLKNHGLAITDGVEQFSITNGNRLRLGSHSTHYIFVTADTVGEGLAYLRGIEDGKKLSQPEKERK